MPDGSGNDQVKNGTLEQIIGQYASLDCVFLAG